MENTTENNKLLAEFLGAKQYDETDNFVYFDETTNIFSNDTISIKDLKFHNDWNWLMEVVEKIESLGNDVLITSNFIQIAYDEGEQFIVIEDFNIKIEAVYNACVEFVKWYKQQNK